MWTILAFCCFHLFFLAGGVTALIFRADQFRDLTGECKDSEGNKPLTYILNEDNPAMYVSIDPAAHAAKISGTKQQQPRRRQQPHERFFSNLMDTPLMRNLNTIEYKAEAAAHVFGGQVSPAANATFNCVLQVQTQLPRGEKSESQYDALSLIIVELDFSNSGVGVGVPGGVGIGGVGDGPGGDGPGGGGGGSGGGGSRQAAPISETLQLSTFGHRSQEVRLVTKPARYTERIWAATNPNFLLSGQLSGFDPVDYRTKVNEQHIVRPEELHSTFDKPASIKVNLSRWTTESHVYMVFTSYRYLRGQRCHEHKEFDCLPPTFLSASSDHMCMSHNLACDGLPNCGQDLLPNQDENCFKIHWSSILLSLVSYILLAVTLLLCLSCFARVIIQWSVRSSLAELRGGGDLAAAAAVAAAVPGGGAISPEEGSFRSSSRFFHFLGNPFGSRWERPPPSYDEALKHVNPDTDSSGRPQAPPAYAESVDLTTSAAPAATRSIMTTTTVRCRGMGHMTTAAACESAAPSATGGDSQGFSGGTTETPPPEYDSQASIAYLELGGGGPSGPGGPGGTGSSYGNASGDNVSSGNANVGHVQTSHPAVIVLPPTPMGVISSQEEFAAAAAAETIPFLPPKQPLTSDNLTVEAEICSQQEARDY